MLILPLSLTLLVPTIICGALAMVIWTKRPQENDDRTPANLLITIVLGCSIGTAAYALELMAPDLSAKLLLTGLGYFGNLILMVATLLFTIWYAGKWSWVSPGKIAALSAGPALILIAFVTNNLHHLFYTGVGLDTSYEIPQMTLTAGPLYIIAGAYILFSFAASLVLLFGARFTIHRGYGSAWPAVVVGLVVPLIAYVMYIAGLRPFGFLDLVPYSITVTAVALTLATLRFNILDLRPVARETLIHDLPAGMMVFDDRMRIIDINPAATRLLGIGREPVLNRDAGRVLPPEDPVLRFCLARSPGTIEVEREGRALEIILVRVPGFLAETIGFLLILQDITEKRQALDAHRLANRKLKMLSGITRHDITNQLIALKGFLLITQSQVIDPAAKAFVDREIKAADTIGDFIQFTRQYDEIGEGEPGWFRLSALVGPLREFAAREGIDLSDDTGKWEVYGDPLLSKVFFNLVDNAIRHGERAKVIRFSCRRDGGDLVVICEDDGTGVPADMKDKIFEKGVGRNTGLGLFIVREILSITGMSIAETGEPGAGARFEIRVPAGRFREPAG
ncbi:MAG TPA: histidine kinase N-terminal 7TM domain-containing protein [Methanoregula sp.]|nr:histidine kinase N-terminal 7TM domain-containing protein [Methanoregula sp.]